jgi:long-chain acyl-CoA synthetase
MTNFFLLHLQGDGAEEKYELPPKEKADICTIMYTSGTTGDPKGVLISNKSIIAIVTAVDEFLSNSNEEVQLIHVSQQLPVPLRYLFIFLTLISLYQIRSDDVYIS